VEITIIEDMELTLKTQSDAVEDIRHTREEFAQADS